MKRLLQFFSFFLISICFSTLAWSGNIIYPWRATTAIVKAGETFEVWFNADAGQTVSSIQLKNAYITISATQTTELGTWIYDKLSNNTYNTKIKVTVPATSPADRYDIVLITSSGTVTSPSSVKVIKDYKAEYYIVHFSDVHRWQGGYDTENVILRKVSTIIDIANIIDAEMIFETGDNMYGGSEARALKYFGGTPASNIKGLYNANAATFTVPGNHDVVSSTDVALNAKFINTLYGLSVFNFTYGNGRFINVTNGWGGSANPTRQANDAKTWLTDVGRGNFVLCAGHARSESMQTFYDILNFDVAIYGHQHGVANLNPDMYFGKPNQYEADAVRENSKFQFQLYKVSNSTGSFTPVSGTTGQVRAIQSEAADILANPASWLPNLSLSYSQPNNGTSNFNTATITNKFGFAIQGAKVRFVMPLGYTYSVANGTIEQEFTGTSAYIVDVVFNLEANSTKVVGINMGSVVDLCPDDPNKTEPGLCGCGVPEGSCKYVNVSGVELAPEKCTLFVSQKKQLLATVIPADANNTNLSWASSNSSVATVDLSGVVTGIGGGLATITATSQEGKKTASAEITVIADTLTLQAENAVFSGPKMLANVPGYRGTGFLDFTNLSNDYVTWTVNVLSKGTYSLSFRYALFATSSRPLKLTINGEVRIPSLEFTDTEDWTIWENIRTNQMLNAGSNTITLTAIGASGGNFDELSISRLLSASDINTSINNQEFAVAGKTLRIYPNPSSNGLFSIDFTGFEKMPNVQVKIVNVMGQIVYKNTVDYPTHFDIELTGFIKNSIYAVTVESGGVKLNKKLIVN